jgi:hypothetical protein
MKRKSTKRNPEYMEAIDGSGPRKFVKVKLNQEPWTAYWDIQDRFFDASIRHLYGPEGDAYPVWVASKEVDDFGAPLEYYLTGEYVWVGPDIHSGSYREKPQKRSKAKRNPRYLVSRDGNEVGIFPGFNALMAINAARKIYGPGKYSSVKTGEAMFLGRGALQAEERLREETAARAARKAAAKRDKIQAPRSKKRKTNPLEKSAEHPIEVTRHYRSGGPNYLSPWQRAMAIGQEELFETGIQMLPRVAERRAALFAARNPGATKRAYESGLKEATGAQLARLVRVGLRVGLTMAEIKKDVDATGRFTAAQIDRAMDQARSAEERLAKKQNPRRGSRRYRAASPYYGILGRTGKTSATAAARRLRDDYSYPFSLQKDGIEGHELSYKMIPGADTFDDERFQYALGYTKPSGEVGVYSRAASRRGTFGGWRWEMEPSKLLKQNPTPDQLLQSGVNIQIFATRNERARAFVESLNNGALKKALLIGLSKTMDALMADVTVFDMPDFLQTIRHILARQIPNKPKWSAVRAQLLGFFDDREINPSDREIYTRNLKKHARIANKLHDTVKNYYAYLYKGDKEAILKDLKFYFEFTLFDDFRRWYKGSQEKYFGDYLQDEIKRWEGSLLLRQKERESNPSVKAIYEKFNGRPSRRSRNVAAPAGTPRDLAQLGRLRTLKTVDGRTWRFPGDRAPFLAADSRGKLHIVGGQYRANPAGEDCGEIDLIEYQTRKPHLGHHKETIYYHKLGEDTGERPTLKITPEGELVIHGGAYRIESDGIHN